MRKALLTSVGIILVAGPAWAQKAPEPADAEQATTTYTGELVVTARRINERLRDVPMAVTALTSGALAEQGVATIKDLARIAPGLAVTSPNTDPYSPVISMRGQVQNDITLLALDTSVGFYVDDFYISRPNALTAYGTFDLERVEVSRGPQGTLFGRNATGGNVRYITKKADGEFEGYIRGAYGNFNHRELEGAINIPLIGEKLAVRASGMTVGDNGYSRSLAPGNRNRYGDADNVAARVNIIAKPMDAVTIDLAWNHFDGSSGNQAGRLTFVSPGVAALYPVQAAQAVDLRYQTLSSVDHYANAVNNLYTAGLAVDLADNIQFNAIYGRMEIKVDQQFDLVPLGVVGNPLKTHIASAQDSAEARLSGQFFDSRLILQGGLYYLKEHGDTNLRSTTLPAGIGPGSNLVVNPINTARNRSIGIFGQGTFAITPALKLTLGGRYTDERRVGTSSQFTTINALGITRCGLDTTSPAALALLIGPCTYQGIKKDHYFSYLASLDYKPSDNHLLYIKTAKSYRAGGFNPRGTGPETFAAFEPESVTEYEGGYKGKLFDRLNVGVAIFLDRRRNGQQSAVVISQQTGSPITLIGNAVNLNIFGQELEASLKLTDFLTVDGMYTHLGKRLQLSPQTHLNVGATLKQHVGSGTLTARASYTWQSDFDSVPSGCTRGDNLRLCSNYLAAVSNVASYGLLNARIAYKLDQPNIEFAVFGRNIGDKGYDTFKFDGRGSGGSVAYPGAPRTYGVEVRYDF